MVRLSFVGVVALTVVLATCSDTVTPSPAILTITIDPTPAVSRDPQLEISGRVDRDPPAPDLPLVVLLEVGGTAGVGVTDTVGPDGRFALVAPLLADSANEIRLTATDPVGSVGHNGVLVRQDATPPRVLAVTPQDRDLVSPFTAIRVDFTEPVEFVDTPFVALEMADTRVGGIATQSADGMSVSFIPDQVLEGNRPYTIRLASRHDVAGRAGEPYARCFLTRPSGTVFATDGGWVYDSEGSFASLRAFSLRLQRNRDGIAGAIDVDGPIAVSGDVPELTAFFDFDTDHDTSTGVMPARDSLLGAAWPLSGIGADHGIVLTLDSVGGIVRAGPKSGPLSIVPTVEGQVSDCWVWATFSLPLNAVGAPDTTTAWVSAVYWVWPNGWRAAGLPDSGSLHGFSR